MTMQSINWKLSIFSNDRLNFKEIPRPRVLKSNPYKAYISSEMISNSQFINIFNLYRLLQSKYGVAAKGESSETAF